MLQRPCESLGDASQRKLPHSEGEQHTFLVILACLPLGAVFYGNIDLSLLYHAATSLKRERRANSKAIVKNLLLMVPFLLRVAKKLISYAVIVELVMEERCKNFAGDRLS